MALHSAAARSPALSPIQRIKGAASFVVIGPTMGMAPTLPSIMFTTVLLTAVRKEELRWYCCQPSRTSPFFCTAFSTERFRRKKSSLLLLSCTILPFVSRILSLMLSKL